MELARAYPNPNDIPALSLREALRLIAGKQGNRNEKHFAHEPCRAVRLSSCSRR